MYKYFIAAVIFFVFTSCSTTDRLSRKCERWSAICSPEMIVDSVYVHDSIIIKDTIVKYILNKDTVYLFKELYVPKDVFINIDTMCKESGIIGVKAWVNDNNLGVLGYVADSSVFIELKGVVRENIRLRRTNRIKTIVREVVRNSSFANFTVWFFWIFIILVFFYIFLKKVVKKFFY